MNARQLRRLSNIARYSFAAEKRFDAIIDRELARGSHGPSSRQLRADEHARYLNSVLDREALDRAARDRD